MSLESQPCFLSVRATRKPGVPFSTANIVICRLRPASPDLAATKYEIAVHAVGDEHLGAVQHVAAGDLARGGAHGGQVRAGVGLGHGHGGDLAAGGDVRHPALELLARAGVIEVRRGHVGVHQHGDGEAAVGGAAELLRQHGVGERIEARAAELGRIAHAEQAERAHLAQGLARHVALLLPGIGERHHAIGDEAPDRVAQHRVLFAEVGEAVDGDGFGHALSSSELGAPAALHPR